MGAHQIVLPTCHVLTTLLIVLHLDSLLSHSHFFARTPLTAHLHHSHPDAATVASSSPAVWPSAATASLRDAAAATTAALHPEPALKLAGRRTAVGNRRSPSWRTGCATRTSKSARSWATATAPWYMPLFIAAGCCSRSRSVQEAQKNNSKNKTAKLPATASGLTVRRTRLFWFYVVVFFFSLLHFVSFVLLHSCKSCGRYRAFFPPTWVSMSKSTMKKMFVMSLLLEAF